VSENVENEKRFQEWIATMRRTRDAFSSAGGYSTLAAVIGIALFYGARMISEAIRESRKS
jgi:hypothetical protein